MSKILEKCELQSKCCFMSQQKQFFKKKLPLCWHLKWDRNRTVEIKEQPMKQNKTSVRQTRSKSYCTAILWRGSVCPRVCWCMWISWRSYSLFWVSRTCLEKAGLKLFQTNTYAHALYQVNKHKDWIQKASKTSSSRKKKIKLLFRNNKLPSVFCCWFLSLKICKFILFSSVF